MAGTTSTARRGATLPKAKAAGAKRARAGSGQPPRGAALPGAGVYNLPMESPEDVSALARLFASGDVLPEEVLCLLVKTEGNGLDNDFSRTLATRALGELFREQAGWSFEDLLDRVTLMASGGVEGVLSPHMLVFTRRGKPKAALSGNGRPRLAIGRAVTRRFKPAEVATKAQAEATRKATLAAIRDAGLSGPDEVVYVQVKGAIPDGAAALGLAGVRSPHQLKPAMRATSAAGVGRALGDVDDAEWEGDLSDASGAACPRCCVTASTDRPRSEVVVFGMSDRWQGDTAVAHTVMADMLDTPAVAALLARLGLAAGPQLDPAQRARLIGAVLKGDPPAEGRLRGARHVMWRDSDVHALRHFRAAMGAILAGLTGETKFYISAGAERQGAPGASLAVFARLAAGNPAAQAPAEK
ncbi:MAG: ring-opening amidohydrolase [Kiloniellaceae bacterium]